MLGTQCSRDGQNGIAQGLGVQPAPVGSPQQPVLGILGGRCLQVAAALPVGGRQQNLPVQGLDRVVALDEAVGQVFQQFRVSGWRAQPAEVAGGSDDALMAKWFCQMRLTMTRADRG